jgi:hypothetical protein
VRAVPVSSPATAGYKEGMRFRTGLIIGLAIGYYYGTKAGHERYEQIEQWLDRIRSTTTYQDARTKVSDGFREGATAARRLIDDATGGAVTQGVADDSAPLPDDRALGDPTFN